MTRVVNIRGGQTAEVAVCRPGKWGNPFVIGKHGSRAEVIARHAQWIWTQPQLIAARHELRGKTLGCWCKPLPCHGDTLAKLAEMRHCAIVCGGRDYIDDRNMRNVLSRLVVELEIDCIVTGDARGADMIAHELALEAEMLAPIEPADWERHGKAAGPKRNQLMLDKYPVSIVIAFPGGRGTADMVRRAVAAGLALVVQVSATGEISYV
jgi:hypothetical protein